MNFNNKFNKAIKTTRSRSESIVFNVGKKYKSGHILLYGCEIWGFHCVLEICLQKVFFLKILHLSPSTPSCMVYGKVGNLPL